MKPFTYYTENLTQVKLLHRQLKHLHSNNWKALVTTSETFYMDYWNAFTHTSKSLKRTGISVEQEGISVKQEDVSVEQEGGW